MNRAGTLLVVTAIFFIGCASQRGYRPVVDTHNDPYAANITRDQAECRELAQQASGGTATEAAEGAVVGGALGAAAGAAIGAAAGDPGKGAAIGAAAGGLGGGTYKGVEAEDRYKHAFRTCMRNRGHNVVD
jgi:outer membrane lipoprotein SlyB